MAIDFDRLALGPGIKAFGECVWYRPAGQQPIRIRVVPFMGAHMVTGIGDDGVPISDIKPVLGLRLADLMAAGIDPQQGDKVTMDLTRLNLGVVDFQVSDIDPDGEGGAKLSLNQFTVPA
jgi:hypothetical protein